ncbi:HAD family hydrolase [Vibrio sonorensis]|uniref:HAD family hydrolase n=1 Tax=Vibrio sonorensis TaxID=1004316 RepID=UPI0008DB2761|nr:HAD family hydrolase [Vibrio sonorensis]
MYKTVIFDYGNTLCEMGCLINSLMAVLDSQYAEQVGKQIEKQIHELYIPDQVEQPEWIEIWDKAFKEYDLVFDKSVGLRHLNHFVDSGRLYKYSIPLLEALSNQGTKLTLLSNVTGSSEVFQRDITARGLSKYFDSIIWSSEIGFRKPSRQAFEVALNSTDSSALTSIMVGDSEVADIYGAKSVGLSTMLISERNSIKSEATFVVNRNEVQERLIRLTNI